MDYTGRQHSAVTQCHAANQRTIHRRWDDCGHFATSMSQKEKTEYSTDSFHTGGRRHL